MVFHLFLPIRQLVLGTRTPLYYYYIIYFIYLKNHFGSVPRRKRKCSMCRLRSIPSPRQWSDSHCNLLHLFIILMIIFYPPTMFTTSLSLRANTS